MLGGHKGTETQGGERTTNLQMSSQRRDTSPSNNGTNELIANLDHELIDVRTRAVKCLLRKLEWGIISSDSLKYRVDLLDRCKRWLRLTLEGHNPDEDGSKNFRLDADQLEGAEVVSQLLCVISKHKEFRDLLRKENVDNVLSKLQPFLAGDCKCQLSSLLNALVVGQYELTYEDNPPEWFDNKTCAMYSSRHSDLYSSRNNPYNFSQYTDDLPSPTLQYGRYPDDESSKRNTPETSLPKKSSIPLSNEDGWLRNIQLMVPFLHLSGSDKRVIHSTVDSLGGTNDSLVLMTTSFVRDTLTMDYPSELFIQEPSLILALAQVTVSRWSDHRVPYVAIQTLLKISNLLRFRFVQLNSSDLYQIPTIGYEQQFQKQNRDRYYDYDGLYSSRITPKAPSSAATNATDNLIENFIQLFKSFSRSLQYMTSDLHIWTVFESFAFTLFKCVSIFPMDSKSLTMSLQGVLMELAHIWERKTDFHTTVGICLVTASLLNAMKINNESFIVSKDVRSMLRSLSYSPIIRGGWPEVCEYFLQFSGMFDPSATTVSERQSEGEEIGENHPKKKILKLMYSVQNASSHDEVLNSVDSLRDTFLPMVLNIRLGEDKLAYILHDIPWRDTFYRFLCVEPTTEGDEELLGRVLDLFTYILKNVKNAKPFRWIAPLCCEKGCTALKLLGVTGLKKEVKCGGTAIPDLLRSLVDFYSAVLKHGNDLMAEETKWEVFQMYTAILESLKESSYSNFALLTVIIKELAILTEDKNIQRRITDEPIIAVALMHRITDAVMVLDANGSIHEGYKNNGALYYLSISLVYVLVPVLKNDNFKNFKTDWIERCGRTFHILTTSPDMRLKAQAFQVCEVLMSCPGTKYAFAEVGFKDSMVSLLEMAYSTFIEQKYPSAVKFRAGNLLLHVLKHEEQESRLKLAQKLHQTFAVLTDMSRISSHVLWHPKLSVIAKEVDSGSGDHSRGIEISGVDGIPFITSKVLTVLCRIVMLFLQSFIETNGRDSALQEVTSSGICQMLFRITLRQTLKTDTDPRTWLECCCAVSTVLETLINLAKLDRTISIILIGEKRCLSAMFDLLDVKVQPGANQQRADDALSALCGNVLILAAILCCDGGSNFEDLERVSWSHQEVLFTKLSGWLNVATPATSRKAALGFTHAFFSILSQRTKPEVSDQTSTLKSHPFLCRSWKENLSYGQILCENLFNIMKQAVDTGERISAMKSLSALFTLSSSSILYAVEEISVIRFCVQKLHSFGAKFFEAKGTSLSGKKQTTSLHTETLSYMELLSCAFYVNAEAKSVALKCNFPDVLHKIFDWWTYFTDFTLLHAYIEALLNFTEEFPEGALALTMTSNVVGVAPRRVPTQQSIYVETIAILEKELTNIESNHPNLKTIEILFELQKNICFVQECRNILLKSPIMVFLRKFHVQETKKWGSKQNAVKVNYLDFLVHASAHSDVQMYIAKIPEGLEILVQITESDHPPASILALKVLRNLCFQTSNKVRLISENMLIPSISNKLSQSSDLQEIEHASVSLWALISNYEKGRLNAKKSYCSESLSKALERIRKMEQNSNLENEEIVRLISLLEAVQKVLGTTTSTSENNRLLSNGSRTSSMSQL